MILSPEFKHAKSGILRDLITVEQVLRGAPEGSLEDRPTQQGVRGSVVEPRELYRTNVSLFCLTRTS